MIYTIKNKYLTLEVDSQGAEAIHLVYKGINYLRERDEVWDRTAPILFPIVGRLKDGVAYYDGKKITLGVHGFAASRNFSVKELKEDEITLIDRYDEDTLAVYPFKYEICVTYRLVKKSYDTIIKVRMFFRTLMTRPRYYDDYRDPYYRDPRDDRDKRR